MSLPAEMNRPFPYTETLFGKMIAFDPTQKKGVLATSYGNYHSELSENCTAELIRNLDAPYIDYRREINNYLLKGSNFFAMGVIYPKEGDSFFEIHHIIFLGSEGQTYMFQEAEWWIRQIEAVSRFYFQAQFGSGKIDYKNFRSLLSLSGEKYANRQETNNFSRFVSGMAKAYALTGNEIYLESAQKGVAYLMEHLRFYDPEEELVYWYHACDVLPGTGRENKIFASEYGDDYDAIAAVEQIYALSGLTHTYRLTGDPEILTNIKLTIKLFETYFYDKEEGGYFTHLDPVTLNPRAPSLGVNQGKKNWNSIGDHLSVYLLTLWSATQDKQYSSMIKNLCDLILAYFVGGEGRFIYERFFEDWSPDLSYLWQKEAVVVGHQLKIIWVLLRSYPLFHNEAYAECAKKLLKQIIEGGRDPLRGGWYDVLERTLRPGESCHRFFFHDRKVWWQQGQAILALTLASHIFKEESYFTLAKESAAFYNAFFLDHQDGGVFANVQANGIPYLMGSDRYKGSRWNCALDATELAYFAAIYNNLFLSERHVDLYFRPLPGGFKDRTLFVAPDIFLPDTVMLEQVWVDDKVYKNFNDRQLSIPLPDSGGPVYVKARLRKA